MTEEDQRQREREKPSFHDIIGGLEIAIPEATLPWTWDLNEPVNCLLAQAILGCTFCL